MRVLLANVCCKEESTGKIVYDLYHGLRKDGHEAVIAYGRGRRINEPAIYRVDIPAETYIHAGLTRLTGYTGCFSPLSTRRLIRLIDEFQPDVINLHEMHAYFMNIRHLVEHIRRRGIPTVWTFHCEEMYTGKCGYAYDCARYKTGCGNCPAVHDYPKSLWFDQTSKIWQANKDIFDGWDDVTIVTPSQWLAERVKSSFLGDKRVEVIHNGIDTENIFHIQDSSDLRQKYHLTGKKVTLSVMHSIHDPRKGGSTVLALSKMMPDLQFVIIGADKTEKHSDNCLLVQKQSDQNELARWYSLADVFLICSTKENFPTTCIEAMCCGAPVVGIDSGGTKETVPPPDGRFIQTRDSLSADDLHRLAEAVRERLEKGCSHTDISQRGIARYARDVMYKKYISLYRDICKTN